MHASKLASIDLNLLVLFDALLAERNVTRAAKKVALSQSAASHALARLRALTGDELFSRGPRGVVPTARALALAAPVRDALSSLERALGGAPHFDPASAQRSFSIVGGDLSEIVLLPGLLARLGASAPGVDLRALPASPDAEALLERGEVDLAIGPALRVARGASYFEAPLFEDGFVCVVNRSHALARGKLTAARYLAARHAVVAARGRRGGVVDDLLAARGLERRVVLSVPHFMAAPHIVAQSDLVLTLPTRVARVLAAPLGLALLKPPFELPRFTMSMVWHLRSDADPAHRWLREQLSLVAGRVSTSSSAEPRRRSRRRVA